MRFTARLTLALGLLLPAAAAHAQPLQFFGLDKRPRTTTNAPTARSAFLANLQGVGTETFESYAIQRYDQLTINFQGAGSALLKGGQPRVDNDTQYGRTPTSGTQWLDVTSSARLTNTFSVSFAAPVAAFGFYGTDIGDYNSQLTLRFTLVGGDSWDWTLPYVAGTTQEANRLYAGVIDARLFTKVTFIGTNADDGFGFDDMTIGSLDQVVPPATTAPEPGTIALLATGLGALGVGVRRRRAAA